MVKVRYQIDLPPKVMKPDVDGPKPRVVSGEDHEPLAALMLDAYIGTIDYEGEGYEDALTEVSDFLADTLLLEHSFAVAEDGVLLSAVLVSQHEGQPFIGYVMTRSEHKGKGLARTVTRRALASLAESGHEVVVFYITEGNRPSEALFRSLGAVPVPVT